MTMFRLEAYSYKDEEKSLNNRVEAVWVVKTQVTHNCKKNETSSHDFLLTRLIYSEVIIYFFVTQPFSARGLEIVVQKMQSGTASGFISRHLLPMLCCLCFAVHLKLCIWFFFPSGGSFIFFPHCFVVGLSFFSSSLDSCSVQALLIFFIHCHFVLFYLAVTYALRTHIIDSFISFFLLAPSKKIKFHLHPFFYLGSIVQFYKINF